MERAKLGRAIERLLRCTEVVACPVDASTIDSERGKAIGAYGKAFAGFEKDRERHTHLTQSKKLAALAKDWLDAYQDVQVFDRLRALLAVMQDRTEAVVRSTDSPVRTHSALELVSCVSFPCFTLLTHACDMVTLLRNHGSSSAQEQAADSAMAALGARDFMHVVAAAVRSVVAAVALAHSQAGQLELHGSTASTASTSGDFNVCLEVAAQTAVTVSGYVFFLAEGVYYSVKAVGADGTPPAPIQSQPEVVRVVEALVDSHLLAAAVTALVDSPAVSALPGVDTNTRLRVCGKLQGACKLAGIALFCVQEIQLALSEAGGPEGQRLACGLLRAMRHVAVRRLQVGLLDQLAAHAGMGAKLQEGGNVEEAAEQQQAGRVWEGDGWEGSSGTWWFAWEEAQQGRLLVMDLDAGDDGGRRGGHTTSRMGLLEDIHCHTVYGAFGTWGGGVQEQVVAAAAGVPSGPPPLLAARLAARGAEALCRLCRGQGLEGAYKLAPEWQFAMAPGLVLQMLPTEYWDSLPPATARACAPCWLEAAGWLAALQSDATAAAMGHLPAAPRPGQRRSYLRQTIGIVGSQAKTLVAVVLVLARLALHGTYGFKTLPAAAQADVLRRMRRCRLAASLDHTLRLAFSAQVLEGSGQAAMAKDLGDAIAPALDAIDAGLVPLLAPVGGQEAEGTDGGEAAGDQLGLLLTLSKRAAISARALEGEGDGAAGAQQQWVDRATEVLALLAAAAASVVEGVRDRVAAVAARRAVAVTGSCAGDASDPAGGEVMCVDEAHEALALATREISSLATALAWRLAADVGTAAAGAPAVRGAIRLPAVLQVLCGALACAVQWWRHPPLLLPAQLLACQPHRLLAAACALAAALPVKPKKLGKHKQRLCALVASAVAVLSSRGTLSGRARGWLAAPPAATAAGSGDPVVVVVGGGGDGSSSEDVVGSCAGCLAAPLLALVRQVSGTAPSYAAHTVALLRLAGGGEGSGAAAGEADGGFQRFAQEVAEVMVADSCRDAQPRGELNEVPLPDGSLPYRWLLGGCEGDGAGGTQAVPVPLPAAPPEALPPPLALQPSRQGALTRLRVCGNPRCGNFSGECEGALPFKQCGGCRAVRYCGADCQREHWREGHRAECKLLAAET